MYIEPRDELGDTTPQLLSPSFSFNTRSKYSYLPLTFLLFYYMSNISPDHDC